MPTLLETANAGRISAAMTEAARDAIAACILLGFCHGNEGFGSWVLHQQIRDDSSAVVGDRGFAVRFVQHLVQTVWPVRATNEVAEGHGCAHKFLRDRYAAGHVGGRSDNDDGGSAAAFISVHRGSV